jgi:hypothetical protein
MVSIKQSIKTAILGKGKSARTVLFGPGKGIRIVADPASDTQRLFGLAEAELHKHFLKFAREAKTFIDVGASNGYYCLLVNKLNPSTRVIACEPQEYLATEFQQNVLLNSVASTQYRFVPSIIGRSGVSIDSLAADAPSPIFLKVDVEGAEADVLLSGESCLSSGRSYMIVETHSVQAESDCERILRSWGYRLSTVDQGWYRAVLPEQRSLAHNRWLIAEPK